MYIKVIGGFKSQNLPLATPLPPHIEIYVSYYSKNPRTPLSRSLLHGGTYTVLQTHNDNRTKLLYNKRRQRRRTPPTNRVILFILIRFV